MAWYSWSKKTDSQEDETKNHITQPVDLSFAEFLYKHGHHDLSFIRMIELYEKVLPFSNAVDIRARSIADTPTRLKNKEGKYIKEHPMLDIIARPNDAETTYQFLYAFSSQYDITGNVFLMATGNVDRPPLELMVVAAHRVSPTGLSSQFAWLNICSCLYVSNDGFSGDNFFAESSLAHGIRYINKNRDKELIPVVGFNPRRSSINFFGMTKLRPALYEMEQYIEGNINNLSNLQRGARPSMIWQNARPEMLTQDQWDRAQEMSQKYSGSQNAGGIPILDGLEARPVSSSNNEMQFRDLQKDMFERINVSFDIPLPMVTSTANTFNNYETAQVALWDNANMPLSRILYGALTKSLSPRYKADGLKYTIDPIDVEPLRRRAIETAKLQNETNINTINEMRNTIGYEDGDKEWDEIYAPMNQTPLGTAAALMGNPDANNPMNQAKDKNDADAEASKKFRLLLLEMKTEDGSQKYSEKDIDSMAIDAGYE
jgi:HK97 family phage portal protein